MDRLRTHELQGARTLISTVCVRARAQGNIKAISTLIFSLARKSSSPSPFRVRHKEQPESQAESVVEPEHAVQRSQERIAKQSRTKMNSHVTVTRC
jgi:hypothetical protein